MSRPRDSRPTFSSTLEEEPDHQDLQGSHSNHHTYFNQAEIEDSLLCALDCAEITVLSCSEVLLHSADRAQLSADLEDRVLKG
jgi:hypothetical protein